MANGGAIVVTSVGASLMAIISGTAVALPELDIQKSVVVDESLSIIFQIAQATIRSISYPTIWSYQKMRVGISALDSTIGE